jgi:hypothetical protein
VLLTCLAIAACVLAAAPSAPPAAAAGKAAESRARLAAFLADHDVPTADELRAVAAPTVPALMAVADDDRAAALVRARAVAGLRLFPSPGVQAYLGKLIAAKAKSSDPADRLLLRRAAVALGWLAGPHTPEDLALLFDNPDPEVRLDAVVGLGLTRSAAALPVLRRQLAVESVPRVRNQIERRLRVLDPPPAEPASPEKERPPMRGGF